MPTVGRKPKIELLSSVKCILCRRTKIKINVKPSKTTLEYKIDSNPLIGCVYFFPFRLNFSHENSEIQ